ncbi:CinA family protein [Pararhodobacter sp. SW119]|uniref:CinA family protein n=1 Tax=Pararhodobacter sp. SW119 TaxID=2780075 RepID=UPI001AE09AF2|nr:CinA family protein [Pararhodobacter sp. SW119]
MSRLAHQILSQGRARSALIATAESCTGGMVGAALTDLPGSSDVYIGGFITYSNDLKRDLLNVSEATLAQHGAVSEPVAQEMATGARMRTGASHAVAITGIAGPGGSEFKPEGRVCFAVASPAGITSETVDFGALGRDPVRRAARDHALLLLARALAAQPSP